MAKTVKVVQAKIYRPKSERVKYGSIKKSQ